jgi:hypothetical protein
MTTIFQAEARDLIFNVQTASGQMQDLTSAVASWRLVGPSATLTKAGAIPSPLNGQVVVELSTADTGIAPGSYQHELRLDLNGAIVTVFQGSLTIVRSLFA